MSKINDLIRYYEENDFRKENGLIWANLRLINDLVENIEDSRDRIYMDKIIATCLEIIDIQKDAIHDYVNNKMLAASAGPKTIGLAAPHRLTTDDIPRDPEEEAANLLDRTRIRNPYTPPKGGFKDDKKVKEAFVNYLKYHVTKKDGTPKKFSDTTVYDYSSRIKVLWQVFFNECQRGTVEGCNPELKEPIFPDGTFLNAYNNVSALKQYVEFKKDRLTEIEKGIHSPYTKDELAENPLNNPRNLANTAAALEKFGEFTRCIEQL